MNKSRVYFTFSTGYNVTNAIRVLKVFLTEKERELIFYDVVGRIKFLIEKDGLIIETFPNFAKTLRCTEEDVRKVFAVLVREGAASYILGEKEESNNIYFYIEEDYLKHQKAKVRLMEVM